MAAPLAGAALHPVDPSREKRRHGYGLSPSVPVYLRAVKKADTFTISFFPPEYKKALGYMGYHSGRNENKAAAAGLTPVELPEEAQLQGS